MMHRRIFFGAPSRLPLLIACGITVALVGGASVRPAAAQGVIAFDQASNYPAGNGASSQVTTLNGGTGFSSAFREAVNGGGYFVGDATANGNSGTSSNNTSINSPNGNSFGIYGGNGNGTTGESLQRTLSSALKPGDTLSFGLDNGLIDSGFTDQFAIGSATSNNLITVGFQGGGQNYLVNGVDTGLFYTPNGLRIAVKFSSATAFTVTVATLNNPNAPVTVAGTVAAGSTLNTITVSNTQNHGGPASDFFVNSIQVTAAPEPTSLVGMFAGALLFPLACRRRRAPATVVASLDLR